MSEHSDVQVRINGIARSCRVEPRLLLSDFLRDELGLTGTHVGCEHGVCGVCTIMFNGRAARSCLMFAVQAADAEIETIEGLAKSGAIGRLQALFAEKHALQCGYCTPGMLIVAYDLLRQNRHASTEEIRDAMSAVLCRCTGYDGIVKAVTQAARENAVAPADGEGLSGHVAR